MNFENIKITPSNVSNYDKQVKPWDIDWNFYTR